MKLNKNKMTGMFGQIKTKLFLLLLVICFFVVKNFFYDVYKLNKVEELSGDVGYLYEVVGQKSGQKFMLVSDTLISEEQKNKNEFTFTFLDKSNLWNPKSCAKMPSVIDKEGNISMIEVLFSGDRFIKRFVTFDRLTMQKRYLDINKKVILSDLFLKDGIPYFFERASLGVYKTSLSKVSINKFFPFGVLNYDLLLLDSTRDLITAKKEEEGLLMFTRFTKLVKKEYFAYDEKKNSLNELKGYSDLKIPIGDMSKKRKLAEGVYEYRSVDNELSYGIVDEKGNVSNFLLENSKVYLFVISAF